jgi:hypothetical protein
MGIPVNCLDCTETMFVPDYDSTSVECPYCGTAHEVWWTQFNRKGVVVRLPVEDEDE